MYYIFIHYTLWAVVNLNSNRTCPVCTGLPDNSMYWPDPMVQYVALTRLTYDRDQLSSHSPDWGLTKQLPWRVQTFTVPGLILGLFDRPHWLSPPYITAQSGLPSVRSTQHVWCYKCSLARSQYTYICISLLSIPIYRLGRYIFY